MALNLATFNVSGLRDPRKCACLLSELSHMSVSVAAVQETHFTCAGDCRLQENNSFFQHTEARASLKSLY